jgi:hypothetical protein
MIMRVIQVFKGNRLPRLNLIAKKINHFTARQRIRYGVNDKFERLEGIAVYSGSFTSTSNNYLIEDKDGYDQSAASSPYPANESFICVPRTCSYTKIISVLFFISSYVIN